MRELSLTEIFSCRWRLREAHDFVDDVRRTMLNAGDIEAAARLTAIIRHIDNERSRLERS